MTPPAEAADGESGKRRHLQAGAVRPRLDVVRSSARGLGIEMGKRAVETRMFDSALALASRLFVAVIPVALLVSSFLPGGQTFAERLATGLQLHGAGRVAAERLFATPDVVRAGMTVATCLVAAWSLMSCGGVLQRTYRSAWRLETLGSESWQRDARHRLLWAAGLVVYVWATFGLADVSADGVLAIARDGVRVTLALAFFSWGPYVVLGRRVAPRRLLPTAMLGAVALGAVTAVAPLYLPHVASASARSYGLVGFAFAFLTWLFVQALLIVGSAVAGAVIGERVRRRDSG